MNYIAHLTIRQPHLYLPIYCINTSWTWLVNQFTWACLKMVPGIPRDCTVSNIIVLTNTSVYLYISIMHIPIICVYLGNIKRPPPLNFYIH